ncbi:(2Fe-2S)-binding protein [Kitasatospora purpeofusca]|uniref:(2Fe-2S)-binding protein n=1 Tax=Kitasatospora purpeofusca TaxID=67352 RepID=UPI002E119A80|nr:(2Fe-2S)-binding protein [Kitasatospora purpeofusca]WSR37824.1 (2Fe-2S)-binding protein [Kitasatospora purpeofusca]
MTEPTSTVHLRINGADHTVEVTDRLLLCDLLRRDLHLTGTHIGCEVGQCGACTVLLDSHPARSCLVLAVAASGSAVTTVEGISPADGSLSHLQESFRARHALQCGFCTPGLLIAVAHLLDHCPTPDRDQVREVLTGHLCRCTGYQPVIDATVSAARLPQPSVRTESARSTPP